MMFDFRGHGDSTTIDQPDAFWTVPINKGTIKTKAKEEIDVKDYINSNAYLPVLVNDIAAVKAYLDRLHDKGAATPRTRSSSARRAAHRSAPSDHRSGTANRLTPPAMMGKLPTVSKRAEGSDIIAAVFLTATPNLSTKRT